MKTLDKQMLVSFQLKFQFGFVTLANSGDIVKQCLSKD